MQQYTAPRDQWVQERNADGSIYQRNALTGEMKAIEKSDVLPAEAVRQKVEIATAGKPVTTIDQRAPDSFERTYGEGQAKGALDVIAQGDKASSIYQRNQVLRALNTAVQTGKITPAQATIGAWAKSVGIDPATLGIDPSLPTNAETFNALSNESMMSKLGPGGFPSQNFSDTDRKFLEKTVTNLGDQPGANELKLAVSDRISQLQMEKADKWQEISTSVPRAQRAEAYDKFERDWRKDMKTRNVFGDIVLQTKEGEISVGQERNINGIAIKRVR